MYCRNTVCGTGLLTFISKNITDTPAGNFTAQQLEGRIVNESN